MVNGLLTIRHSPFAIHLTHQRIRRLADIHLPHLAAAPQGTNGKMPYVDSAFTKLLDALYKRSTARHFWNP